ncbi:hypothetical protein CH63R_08500 [Colletotrichum higginsianum IMI 349063]|uniref:Uncharacterized protein n=1 Tax=Colletotrichum higginsianum (strain IMI 349063) TaxID=759273 RepID=A0A1B7Y4L1_COLHI|nr:hypothetical protein CH63R_08500 [Colletotrichum higginsianum IMI 349063]OBR06979.1 hypothetical protein CH63R_08500 [Colletotrichum higginsianum IMI 349063]
MLTRGESGSGMPPRRRLIVQLVPVACTGAHGRQLNRIHHRAWNGSHGEWRLASPLTCSRGEQSSSEPVGTRSNPPSSGILELELELEWTEGGKAKLSSLPYKEYKYRQVGRGEGNASHPITGQSSRERGRSVWALDFHFHYRYVRVRPKGEWQPVRVRPKGEWQPVRGGD